MKVLIVLFFFFIQVSAQSITEDIQVKKTLIRVWIEENMDYYHIPGIALAVMYQDSLLWTQGFGVKSFETGERITPQALFRIASISKLFTSTAILQLRDAGRLRLDDPVHKYLSWFKIKNPYEESPQVTIRHLLTHTSGLPRESDFPYWTDHKFPTREQLIAMLPQQEMIFPPETKLKYSNLGMALLGEVIAAVSGTPYPDYIQKNILQPLGLKSTKVELSGEDKSSLATGYLRYRYGKPREKAPFTDSKGLMAAANLSSSVVDLARFCRFFYDTENPQYNKILKASTRKEMQRPHWVRPGWESAWGLGFSLSKFNRGILVGHGGWVAGYRSQLLFDPDKKIAVIVMMNTEDFSPYRFAKKILEIMISWHPEETESTISESNLAQLTGKFMDTSYWQVDVLKLGQSLYLYDYSYPPTDDPSDNLRILKPVTESVFRLAGPEGNGELVTFSRNEAGQTENIKIGANYIYPLSQMKNKPK
jgi:CubicO group peptidase (beta-lactamase class C family)